MFADDTNRFRTVNNPEHEFGGGAGGASSEWNPSR